MSFAQLGGMRVKQKTLNDFITMPGDPDFTEGPFSSQSQFPAAAAEKRLLENQSRAFKVGSLMQELGLDVPDNVNQILETGSMKPEESFLEKAFKPLTFLGNVTKLGIQDVITGDMGQQEIGLMDIVKTAWQPENAENIAEQRKQFGFSTSGSDLLTNLGIPEAESTGGKIARGVAHFFVDVATDPLSYLSLGAAGLGRKVLGATGQKTSDDVLRRVVRGFAENAYEARWGKKYSGLVEEATQVVYDKYGLIDEAGTIVDDLLEEIGQDVLDKEVAELAQKWLRAGIQDELIAPLIARDFASLPKDALELPFDVLPAYARGGARISVPFFGTKSLRYGMTIPGTVGKGRAAAAPFQQILKKVGENTNTGRFFKQLLKSVGDNTDIDRALLRGVKEGKISGSEWALLRTALARGTRVATVTEMSTKLNGMYDELKIGAENLGIDLADIDRLAWSAVNEPQEQYHSRLAEMLGGDIDPTERARVHGTLNQFAQMVQDITKEFRDQLVRYDEKFAAISPDRTMYVGIDPAKKNTLRLLAENGILPDASDDSYGADIVRKMLRSVQFGGSAEAAFGSTSHLLSQDFGLAPIVTLGDEPAGMFLDFNTLFPNTQTQGAVGALGETAARAETNRFISAVELNDQIQGVITDMVARARGKGVPLDSAETGRLFIENPFDSFLSYTKEVVNSLAYLDIVSTLDEVGLAVAKVSSVDFQKVVNNMAEALQDPNVVKHLKDKAEELSGLELGKVLATERRLGERVLAGLPDYADVRESAMRYGNARPVGAIGMLEQVGRPVYDTTYVSTRQVVRDSDAYAFKYGTLRQTNYRGIDESMARGAVIGPEGEFQVVVTYNRESPNAVYFNSVYEAAGEVVPTGHDTAYLNMRRRMGDDRSEWQIYTDLEESVRSGQVVRVNWFDTPERAPADYGLRMGVQGTWENMNRQQREQLLEFARAHNIRYIQIDPSVSGIEYETVIDTSANWVKKQMRGAFDEDKMSVEDARRFGPLGNEVETNFTTAAIVDLKNDRWVPLSAQQTDGKFTPTYDSIAQANNGQVLVDVVEGKSAVVTFSKVRTSRYGDVNRVRVVVKSANELTPRLREDLKRFALHHDQDEIWVMDQFGSRIELIEVTGLHDELNDVIRTLGRDSRHVLQARLAAIDPAKQADEIALLSEVWGAENVADLLETTVPAIQFNDRVKQLNDIVSQLLDTSPGLRRTEQLLDDSGDVLRFSATDEELELLKNAQHLARMLELNDFRSVRTGFNPASATVDFVSREGFVDPRIFNLGGKALKGKQVEENVARWMEQLVKNMQSVYTPIGIANLKDTTNSVMRWWKGMATITRPTFHVRNLIGGVWNNQIIGVRGRDYARIKNNAVKFRQWIRRMSLDDALARLEQESGPETRRVFEWAYKSGLADASFARSEYRAVREGTRGKASKLLGFFNPFDPDEFGLVRGGALAMESVEDFLRLSAFSAWLDVTDDVAAEASALVAKEMAIAVHFDYSHLTEFESAIKQIVPFFVWQRRNIPLQLAVMLERPGLMSRYAHLMNTVSSDEQTIYDDYPRSDYWTAFAAPTGAVLHEGTPFWARLIFDPDLPPTDLFNTIDPLNPGESMRNMFDLIGPQFTLPFDLMQQEEFGDVNAPAPLNAIVRQLSVLGLFDERRTEEGDFRIPYSVRTIWNTIFPFYRDVVETPIGPTDPRQQAALGDTETDQNMLRRLGLSAARGAGLQLQTPALSRSAAYKADRELSKVLERVQLSSGITPEEKEDFDKRYSGFRSGRN